MVGMARANYHAGSEFPSISVTSIPLVSLRTLIARTIFAISNEESRYTLNGALLVLKEKLESLAMIATDGHRLSFCREARREPGRHQRRKARADSAQGAAGSLQILLANSEAEKVEFADDEHTLFFRVGHRTLESSRKLTGQFPNFGGGDAAR